MELLIRRERIYRPLIGWRSISLRNLLISRKQQDIVKIQCSISWPDPE